MLQVIVSPAKQMSADADAFAPRGIPPFPRKTERLWRELLRIEREAGAAGLKGLWGVSDKLLAENVERLHEFVPVADAAMLNDTAVSRCAAAAVFSYIGIQYRSMAPVVMDDAALDWLERHLWILSGLYGCARPFDAVEPYRLEMAAKLPVDGARDLYAFWAGDLAREIAGAGAGVGGAPVVVNLASVEYARAVLPHLPEDAEVVTCIFGEELRAGKPVQRAGASKIARGSMVRWMAEHAVEDARELARFDVGYRIAPELADAVKPLRTPAHHTTLVFMRSA